MQLKKHISPGRCQALRCDRKTHGRKLCSTHRAQKSREADPVRYAYTSLKNNAKRRDILFTITLAQFRKFCRKVKYIGFSGRSADSYTIDRIYNNLGYHIDNIKVMTKADNIKKYFTYDWRRKEVMFL